MAGPTSVYWIGSNGHTYVKTAGVAGGVQDYGALPAGSTIAGSTQINDPNPSPASVGAPANPNNSVAAGGGGGTQPADKSNDIALQNAGLSAVDTQTAAGLSAIDRALGGITGQYDTESANNEGVYHTNSDTNQNNLQKNKQSALVNAAQGKQGLNGTLASLGALNGSGIELANRAVQQGANEDLSGAADNFASNQGGLDTAITAFRNEDKQRRDQANTAAEDARTSTRNNAAKTKQQFYSNLASDYSAQGDADNASKFTGLAASLYPEVANTSIPSTNLAYTGAAFTAPTLASYLAGGANTQVRTSPTGGAPGQQQLIAQTTDKKKLQPA